MTRILLEGFRSKKSVNTSEGINVSLGGKRKLLSINDVAETISQYEQYVEERGKCNVIRLTCQVNPICSNVLHNYITEVVKDEGSSDVSLLNYNDTLKDNLFKNVKYKSKSKEFWEIAEAIRDTQLTSNSNGFIYHCGRDIFNNHLIRSNTFKTVCMRGDENENKNFNTIRDDMRTANGEKVNETICYPLEAGVANNCKTIDLHLYEVDDVYTYKDCVKNRMLKKFNGWVGFENKSKMKSYKWGTSKTEELPIERPIMYKNGGDFVDMYPDRSLYSFVPKWNNYRKRIEKNWNYCITYPSSSVTEGFDDIIDKDTNGLKAIMFDESKRSDNGSSMLVIYSVSKHGLSEGDFVNIYKKVGNGEPFKVMDNAEVTNIADNFVFTVFSDVVVSGENESDVSISYKKVVNDIECDYYVRIFSKLPNFKFASADTFSEYELYKSGSTIISEYQDKKHDFENHISRLAFAKNVYTDEVGQLVFTDDIDISNLRDNLGRPLSSIYITFIKNNKGYKEWYGFDNVDTNIRSENVEFSHCFGKITCGLEMVDDDIVNDDSDDEKEAPKVRKLLSDNYNCIHTIAYKDKGIVSGGGYDSGSINGRGVDNEILYESDKHYYGDLCYYDNYNAIERVIQPFMHRFNTAQRESSKSKSGGTFSEFIYDEFKSDDYDIDDFEIKELKLTKCNDKKEGYYYQPHYEIPIRTFDKLNTAMPDFIDILKMMKDNGKLVITSLQNHYLSIGDKAILLDREKNEYYTCMTVRGVKDGYRQFTCAVYDEKGNSVNMDNIDISNPNMYTMFKMDNLDIPSYARILKDGTCRLIWRDIVNNGLSKEDKSIEEYPFTNGAFYINKRIDIYVRRQDPSDAWGIRDNDDIEGSEIDIENEDYFVKEKDIIC